MLIHQGLFTALYTQHLLDSQSCEFEICILQALHMHQRMFPREAIPSHYFPLLGQGTTWLRQTRSGSFLYPTAATKCNEQPSQATETPSVEKHAHPPRVVYCAVYSTLTRFTKVRQLRSGSCHHPTTPTKCNEQPSQATETPSVERHAHPPRVVYCAIYSTLTRFTKFRV